MGCDERAVRGVHAAWIEAVNGGDLECLLRLMAEDAVFLSPGRGPVGREGFSAGFLAAHQEARVCCSSALEEVVVVGEVAYARSRDGLTVTPRAGGGAREFGGYRMTVYRKQGGGGWVVARDAHTLCAVAE